MEYDLYYLKRRSFLFDLLILARTWGGGAVEEAVAVGAATSCQAVICQRVRSTSTTPREPVTRASNMVTWRPMTQVNFWVLGARFGTADDGRVLKPASGALFPSSDRTRCRTSR